MSRKNRTLLTWLGFFALVIAGLMAVASFSSTRASEYDSFAQCISDSGAKFYGAFWCSHCAEQKRLFGRSVKYVPYIECSTADSRGQLPVCAEAGIEGYPTWVFSDGTRESRTFSLEELAAKTSCALPDAETSTAPASSTAPTATTTAF